MKEMGLIICVYEEIVVDMDSIINIAIEEI